MPLHRLKPFNIVTAFTTFIAAACMLGLSIGATAATIQFEPIRLVITTANGTQANSSSYGPSISADGRYVAFDSHASNLVAGDTNGEEDIFVKDLQTGAITRASTAADGTQANFYSNRPSISADGRYVAFESLASNLVAGDTNVATDVFTDIFIKDLQTDRRHHAREHRHRWDTGEQL